MNNHTYFGLIARTVSLKSKDNSTQVGAVIVDQDNKIVSTGYNGFIAGCDETKLSWERPQKYFSVIHAELNALLFARRDVKNCSMYVTHAPCSECLKNTLQAGIRTIYYESSELMKKAGMDSNEAVIALIEATNAQVLNILTGKTYEEEIREHYMWKKVETL